MQTTDGEQYFVTGDPLIDKWEREVAAGIEPNLDEVLGEAKEDKSPGDEMDKEFCDVYDK